jgi:hypothetical protein
VILTGEQPYVGHAMLTMRDTREFFAERLAMRPLGGRSVLFRRSLFIGA